MASTTPTSSSSSSSHVTEFAWHLLQQGAPDSTSAAGAFTSPVSLYFALALALKGASAGSEQELYHVLHQDKGRLLGLLPPKAAEAGDVAALLQAAAALCASLVAQQGSSSAEDGSGCELVLANGIWTKGVTILPAYVAAVKELFGAEASEVDGVEPINAWAARVTKGLITTAVPPGTPFDVVLTNAVYFKGLWELPFDKAATQQLPFRLEAAAGGGSSGSGSVTVPMMFKTFKPTDATSSRGRYVRFTVADDYSAVRLPYRGGSISALAVLPSEAAVSRAGGSATKAVAGLDVGRLLDEAAFRKPPPAGLDLLLPKFTVKSECVSLKKHLQQMGVRAPFHSQSAKFDRLSDDPLHISDVLQSVCVIVDEEGTEAAAVTSVVMMRCAMVMPADPVVVKFDRPFLFMLVDDATNTPLFLGTVLDPSK